jgi:Gas vesicle protein
VTIQARPEASLQTGSPQITLVDLLDRLLGTGVVLVGDITISLSGVDLVQVKLQALISSVRAEMSESR